MKPSPSMAVIYFGVGFAIGGVISITGLTVIRPLISDWGSGAMMALLFVPLLIGIAFGVRLATVGLRGRLKLGAALKRAVGLG